MCRAVVAAAGIGLAGAAPRPVTRFHWLTLLPVVLGGAGLRLRLCWLAHSSAAVWMPIAACAHKVCATAQRAFSICLPFAQGECISAAGGRL